MAKLKFKNGIFKSSNKSVFINFFITFLIIIFSYIQQCLKIYQLNIIKKIKEYYKKKLEKDIKIFLKKKKKNSNNMVMKVKKISQKMKNINWLSVDKNIIK